MSILLPHITLDIGTSPQHSIIWLHGLGADGEDFVSVARGMNLPVAVRYLFPHAPKRPITINGGMVMRAWYDVISFNGPIDSAGIQTSQTDIENLVTREKQRGIVAKNIYLAGFSQGGAIALYTGLHHAEKLGGIIALSSRFPHAGKLPGQINAHKPPIFMAHGRSDPIIPYSAGSHTATLLKESGYELEWREYAMPHSVCSEEVSDIERWLTRQLSNNSA